MNRRFVADVLERMSILRLVLFLSVLTIIVFIVALVLYRRGQQPVRLESDIPWIAPDTASIPHNADGDLIRYGRKLIASTSFYLGPKGTVAHVANSMNCQNCHIDAGARPFGNSFSAVASMYPQFRPRSGVVESIEFRINDCLLRSLNGSTIDSTSREMRAMVAYLKWVGKDVKKGVKPLGSGAIDPPYLTRAADSSKGHSIYNNKCQVCHGAKGQGIMNGTGTGYVYPPLWGPESYNTGAGLFRLGRFAGYVKFSMPLGSTHEKPQLTDEEAWDVAAFVNSQPRPIKTFNQDWPDLRKKAIDYPYGPYADNFSETQHKYGPFGPIKAARDSMNAGK